jgi:dodecin
MAGGVYKFIEIVGTSSKSVEEAIETAIAEAAKTVHQILWFEVKDTRGRIENGKIAEYQVTVRLGFKIE